MSEIADIFSGLFQKVKGCPTVRRGYLAIPQNHVLGNEGPQVTAVSDRSYFEVVVSEMFIRQTREYWQTYLPFVVVTCDFTFDGNKLSVPAFVSNDLLKSIDKYVHGQVVEFRNTTVIGPAPYSDGSVDLFIGLCRVENEDFAKKIVSFVEDVGKIFPIAQLSTYVQLFEPLRKGISGILGLKDFQMLLGVRDSFADGKLTSGYAAFLNLPDTEIQKRRDEFWIKDDQLWTGKAAPERRFEEADYCVVRTNVRADRPYKTLSFFKLWTDIKKLVWSDQTDDAQAQFLTMCGQMAISPDLTTSDRYNLIRIFKANLEREIQERALIKGGAANVGGDRTACRGPIAATARFTLQKMLPQGDPPARYAQTVRGVEKLVTAWDEVMDSVKGRINDDLTEEQLNRQMRALSKRDDKTGDPVRLLELLTASTMGHSIKG